MFLRELFFGGIIQITAQETLTFSKYVTRRLRNFSLKDYGVEGLWERTENIYLNVIKNVYKF